ncbi:GerAB/ArcD/ProY family transporter [Bacillaceae bacterium S4-13-56]
MKGNIQGKEIYALILLVVGSHLADTTPTILAQSGKNAFWQMPVVAFVVMLPSLLVLLYLLKKYKDKNLVTLIKTILGKYVGGFVVILLCLLVFAELFSYSRTTIDELSKMYFPNSPIIVMYGILIFICIVGARKGFENIANTAWIVVPYIKISVFLLAILIMQEAIWNRIFPIWGDGLWVLVVEGAKKGSLFADVFLVVVAYNQMKSRKSFVGATVFGSFTALIEVTFFFLVYSVVFDYKSIDNVSSPFHEMTRYVSFGTFVTNLETFFMFFWLFTMMIRYVFLLYIVAWIFGELFKIKDFEPLLISIGFLAVVVGIVPHDSIENTLIVRDYIMNGMTLFYFILPFLLWSVSKIKGDLST